MQTEQLSLLRKFWPHDHESIISCADALGTSYAAAARQDDQLGLLREMLEQTALIHGPTSGKTLVRVQKLISTLHVYDHVFEGKMLARAHWRTLSSEASFSLAQVDLLLTAAEMISSDPGDLATARLIYEQIVEKAETDHGRVHAKNMLKHMLETDILQDRADAMAAAAHASAVASCAQAATNAVCYICLEGNAAEGLVRGCACRETLTTCAGFVHISCLVRHATLSTRIDDLNATEARTSWMTCRLCRTPFFGDVEVAISSAYWKAHVSLEVAISSAHWKAPIGKRPVHRWTAAKAFGDVLYSRGRHHEALPLLKLHLETLTDFYGSFSDSVPSEVEMFEGARNGVVNCLNSLGRHGEASEVEAAVQLLREE